jgi:hypothetical protein
VIWNGHEGGKNVSTENLTAIIPSTDYDRLKTAGVSGILEVFGKDDNR